MPQSSMPSGSDTGSAVPGSNGSPLNQDLLDKWAKVRLAHEAMMVQDAQEQLAQSRRAVSEHYKANGFDMPDEDMGSIHIGDQYTTPAPAAPAPAALSGLAKAGIVTAGALALGGGAGLPFALPSIIEALKPAAAVVAPVQPPAPGPTITDTDTDTVFDLFIGPPK